MYNCLFLNGKFSYLLFNLFLVIIEVLWIETRMPYQGTFIKMSRWNSVLIDTVSALFTVWNFVFTVYLCISDWVVALWSGSPMQPCVVTSVMTCFLSCSLPTVHTSAHAWCTVAPTLAVRCETCSVVATCWWRHLADWSTWWSEARSAWTTSGRLRSPGWTGQLVPAAVFTPTRTRSPQCALVTTFLHTPFSSYMLFWGVCVGDCHC